MCIRDRNYIEDTELKEDADDNAMTVEQYLHDYVIPQKGEELGATVRSADITCLLYTSGQINMFEESEDDKDRQANELRNLIGKLPSLSIFIDEVHHAVSDEIMLRAVVTSCLLYTSRCA